MSDTKKELARALVAFIRMPSAARFGVLNRLMLQYQEEYFKD